MTDVYDRKTREILNDMVDAKIKRLWFSNYEENKEIIRLHGGWEQIPIQKSFIVVGAGWSLDKNLWKLKGVDVPVIACDKTAWKVAKFVKPFAVTALNTEKTKIKEWITKFKQVCTEQGHDMNDIWLIVPVTVNPELFEVWSGDKIAFVNPVNTCDEFACLVEKEMEIHATQRGTNVGMFSILMAFSLGAEQIVLLGINYCYLTKKEAETANRGFGYVAIKDINNDNSFDEDGKGYVYTTLEWIDMRTELINYAQDWLNETRIINCSEGGIIYEQGVIEPADFGAWKTFLKGDRIEHIERAEKPSDSGTAEGGLGEELPNEQGED